MFNRSGERGNPSSSLSGGARPRRVGGAGQQPSATHATPAGCPFEISRSPAAAPTTQNTVSRSARERGPLLRTGAAASPRTTSRPRAVATTLRSRDRGTTAAGRAIRQDLQDLSDDYFGGQVHRPLLPSGGEAGASSAGVLQKVDTFCASDTLASSWRTGPRDPAGRCFDSSDRNLLCMDVYIPPGAGLRGGARVGVGGNPLCVVGSADHGLQVFDLVTMRSRKQLYSKTYGHTEWVTTCKVLPDGQVLSGGMDSKLCLWSPIFTSAVRCQDLLGHTASVSQVNVNAQAMAISASYDRTLRVWSCRDAGREVGCLTGHKAAVMQFDWCGSQVLSGDRDGAAKLWDLPTATCLNTLSTKRGAIGALGHLLHEDLGHLVMIGDQGGVLTVLDPRQGKRPVSQREVHPGGALTAIKAIPETPLVVTSGADKKIAILDPRQNFEEVFICADHVDFIYSLETIGPFVLSGAGNGWLAVHDSTTGKCCYGLGANRAAVREIFASPNLLVAAGDDGTAMVYDYDI